ncbi:MAG: ACT domain-containing protein [Eubacteriales bacterium]|nr:ACT domain-containing protein [Eubacteriales bacterium]
MPIEQISIFIENRKGRLADVTRLLASSGINISALSIADTADFGILRLIVNDPDKAIKILKAHDYTVSRTNVIAIAVEDKPGGLADVLEILESYNIDVEYMYAFVGGNSQKALVIMRLSDTDKALSILRGKAVILLTPQEAYENKYEPNKHT